MSKIEKSSKGLRDTLFNELEKLRDGEIDCQRANATAKLVNGIVSTVRLEMDYVRMTGIPDPRKKTNVIGFDQE